MQTSTTLVCHSGSHSCDSWQCMCNKFAWPSFVASLCRHLLLPQSKNCPLPVQAALLWGSMHPYHCSLHIHIKGLVSARAGGWRSRV